MKTSVLVLCGSVLLSAPLAGASALWTAGAEAEDKYERAVRRVFDDVYRREPTDRELRYYARKMEDERWSDSELRSEIRQGVREIRDDRRRADDADRVVRRAYQDILDREPDTPGLRLYRSRMIDDDWSEQDVREALRKSPEYREKNTMTRQKAEDIVARAYRSVLRREPDSGSRGYVDRVIKDKWDQSDVERELRKSPEYRQK
jgi:hypothetical protein